MDEVGSAYDAYSIANYGVDRYIKSYPVYFTNYGDGQNALYTYITALFFRLFGASKLTVRMGIALSSLTAAFFGYLYACRKWKGQEVPLLFLCLYAILPVFTMTQRFGLESHLMLSASITVLYTTARALETEKWQYYLLAGIVMGLSLYTYALMYIVLPLYLLLWLGYGIRLGKIRLRKLLLLLLPLGLLAGYRRGGWEFWPPLCLWYRSSTPFLCRKCAWAPLPSPVWKNTVPQNWAFKICSAI